MLLPSDHPLTRSFAGITEHTFFQHLGLADPPLIDYLSELLVRFLRMDAIYRLKDIEGHRLKDVPEMIREAETLPEEGATRREYYRHIGDFTLFWTGLFPEQIHRMKTGWARDAFVGYCESGKRSYRIASTFDNDPWREESAVLRRLSDSFEMCACGLNQVRRELEEKPGIL